MIKTSHSRILTEATKKQKPFDLKQKDKTLATDGILRA
jgi:hypothetical protein